MQEVPFNLATSPASQKVLDSVRVQPSGWGGIYSDILANAPPLEALVTISTEKKREQEL